MPSLPSTIPHILAMLLTGTLAAQQVADEVYALPSQRDDLHSHSVTGLGDIDGDGVSDFAAGAPRRGAIRIYSGTHGGLMRELRQRQEFGFRVRAAGDMDRDGTPDILVGAPGPAFGRVYVYSGKTFQVIHDIAGNSARFGEELENTGDVDLDGVPDFVVGEHSYSTPLLNQGRVVVYSGATGAQIHSWQGAAAGSQLGLQVSGAGDWDQDGFVDLAVSGRRRVGTSIVGCVKIYSGRTGGVLWDRGPMGTETSIGRKMRAGVDLDGDNIGDIAFTVRIGPNELRYVVHAGGSGSLLKRALLVRSSNIGSVKVAFGFAGDIDGDGITDLGVMAGNFEVGFQSIARNVGAGSIRRGPSLFTFDYEFSGVGDLNGDGVEEVAVGGFSDLPTRFGELRVYSVRPRTLRGTPLSHNRSSGGQHLNLNLDAGLILGRMPYLIVGSASGISPGTDVGAVHVPLNVDSYTNFTIASPTITFHGRLDIFGRARAQTWIPPGLGAPFTLHHAFVVLRSGQILVTSNAMPLRIE